MKRSLKTLFVSILLVICLVSCGSTKKKRATVLNKKVTNEKALIINEKTNIVAERFGDTLLGVMPLPKLGKIPIRYKVSSGGTSLDLELTDSSLSYKVTPKASGKTTTNIDKTTQENSSSDIELELEDNTTTVDRPWRPPFWMYLVGLGLLIAAYYVIKNRLNPFKYLKK